VPWSPASVCMRMSGCECKPDRAQQSSNAAIAARDRLRLELLIRYAARPAVSTERLSELPDGRLLYRLKRPWRDGTSAVTFERQDFMAKLAVLVPAPRAHLTRYHGHPPEATTQILEYLGLPSCAPPLAAAVPDLNFHIDSF